MDCEVDVEEVECEVVVDVLVEDEVEVVVVAGGVLKLSYVAVPGTSTAVFSYVSSTAIMDKTANGLVSLKRLVQDVPRVE